MLLDAQHWKFGFTNSCIIAVIWFSLSPTLNRGQLNLDRFKFWLP
ncbi:DUF645 family protein, partial [Vibrio mimicus]